MQLLSIEGNRQKLDAGSMFGNVPKALWSRWVEVDSANRMELACRALLAIDLKGKNVLFETGIGDFFEPKLKKRFGIYQSGHVLLKSLQAVNLTHHDIDVVVLSHLHFDHAGGLLSSWQENREAELLFPNATYLVSKDHWQRANNPHPRDRASFIPQLNKLLENSGRLQLVEKTEHPLLGDKVHFEYTHGHTPGMMHSLIEDVVFCADLIPGTPWVHVPVSMGYDRFPELLIDEKTTFLQNHFDAGHRLFFTHDPGFSLAEIGKEKHKFKTSNLVKQLNQEY